jgi:hypothetical protein
MYSALYRYFIQHSQLHIPGIGNFLMVRIPAQGDFPNKRINPPLYSVSLQNESGTNSQASRKLFSWIASILNISERDAVMRFNDFAFDLKRRILAGDIIQWKGIGELSRGLAGDIKLKVSSKDLSFLLPVTAEKIVREKAEHMVRVGEEHKTSAQMAEILTVQSSVKKSVWWAWALIAAVLAVMFLGWYFSEKGLSISSMGNQGKLSPATSTANHSDIK